MKAFRIHFNHDRRVQIGAVIFCFLVVLQGGFLSFELINNFTPQIVPGAVFSIRQAILLGAFILLAAGLSWAGVSILRQPQFFQKWLALVKKPAFFYTAVHGDVFLILFFYTLVFGWKDILDRVIPRFNLLYDRYYPYLWWGLLISLQAGILLWLVGSQPPGSLAESRAVVQIAQKRRSRLLEIVAILFGLSLYGLLLRIYIPQPVSFLARYDLAFLIFPVLFVLFFSFRHTGWVSILIGLSVLLALAAFALASLWNSGISEEPIIMGLLPYKDASNYFTEAQLMVNGLQFTSWGGRPIFSLFLAILLRLTGSSLQSSLAILTVITVLCIYFMAREVNRNFGPAVAAFSLFLIFVYYRQFIGSTLTENLGLGLSALGLAFLLQGTRTKQAWITLFGIFLASLALNVRPGPLFLLPMLALWFAIAFRRSKTFHAAIRPFLLSCAIILIPFALNWIMIKSLATPETAMFSRFPQTFYGLVVGGKSWGQIYIDHHEITNLPQNQQAAAIYRLAFQAIRSNPALLVKGIHKNVSDFFTTQNGAFNFIRDALEFRLGLFLLCLPGLGILLKKYKHPGSWLLLAGLAGIILSSPFAPTRDSDRMRTYAGAAAFIVMIPSLSLGWFNLRPKTRVSEEEEPQPTSQALRAPAFILSAVLVAVVTIGPFVLKVATPPVIVQKTSCPAHEGAVYIRVNRGSYVRVIADNAAAQSKLPDLRLSDLMHGIRGFSYSKDFIREPYQPGLIIMNVLDLASKQQVWLAVPFDRLPIDGSIVSVCGHQDKGSMFIFASMIK